MTHIPFSLLAGMLMAAGGWSCSPEQRDILPEDLSLSPGDVVFRQGESFDSHVVRTADRNGTYSHIGIVVDTGGAPMIVHAVPGEPDFDGDKDRIKLEAPDVFFRHDRATIGEVMRTYRKATAQAAARTALRLYRKGIAFDHDYNDDDTTEMYCTELVIYAFRTAGCRLITDTALRSHFSFPIHFDGYLPSAVHSSAELYSVRRF